MFEIVQNIKNNYFIINRYYLFHYYSIKQFHEYDYKIYTHTYVFCQNQLFHKYNNNWYILYYIILLLLYLYIIHIYSIRTGFTIVEVHGPRMVRAFFNIKEYVIEHLSKRKMYLLVMIYFWYKGTFWDIFEARGMINKIIKR